MKEPFNQGVLELNVEDFGPIVKAEIDLRPLTVFIGPSNSGKSYLAILIYALHSLFGGDNLDPHRRRSIRRMASYSNSRRYRDKKDESLRQLYTTPQRLD